ncbi:hypothetical protein V1506DRAFT_469904, partial [Lipomyces tetrasporus]
VVGLCVVWKPDRPGVEVRHQPWRVYAHVLQFLLICVLHSIFHPFVPSFIS